MLNRQLINVISVLVLYIRGCFSVCPSECISCVNQQCEDCEDGYQIYYPYPDGLNPTCDVINQTENVFGLKELHLPDQMLEDIYTGESVVVVDHSERFLDYNATVVGWEFNADMDGSEPAEFVLKFQVWEPLSTPAMTYRLRGQSILDETFFTTGSGIYRLDLAPENQFKIKQGDVIGFACDNYQPIRFAYNQAITMTGGTQMTLIESSPGPVVNVGDTFTFADAYGASSFYTYHAILKQKVCPPCCNDCVANTDPGNGHGDWHCTDPNFYNKVSKTFGVNIGPTVTGSIIKTSTVDSALIDDDCGAMCVSHEQCQAFFVEGTTCNLVHQNGGTMDVTGGQFFEFIEHNNCL